MAAAMDPQLTYATLGGVWAIIAALQTAVLLGPDTRRPLLAAQRGEDRSQARWNTGVAAAKRTRNVAWAVVGLVVLMGAATLVPWGQVTFGDLDGDWKYVLPW